MPAIVSSSHGSTLDHFEPLQGSLTGHVPHVIPPTDNTTVDGAATTAGATRRKGSTASQNLTLGVIASPPAHPLHVVPSPRVTGPGQGSEKIRAASRRQGPGCLKPKAPPLAFARISGPSGRGAEPT
jgi:hypothetical protein